MSEHVPLGNALITVTDDFFINSFLEGYLCYRTEQQGKILTEAALYQMLVTNLSQECLTEREKAGRIFGWIAGLLERKADRANASLLHTHPRLKEQRGNVTLPDDLYGYGG